MEAKRCFNCRRVSYNPGDFDLQSNQRQPLEEYISYNGLKALFGGQRPSVCADCVYDRLQICQLCSRKVPLSLYNIEEWFKSSGERVCQECAAVQATQIAFRNGLMLKDTFNQCFECSKFKSIYSFLSMCHLKQFDVICRECHIYKDIKRYHLELNARYAQNLSLAPALTQVQVDLKAIETLEKPLVSYARVLVHGPKPKEDEISPIKQPDVLALQCPPDEAPSFFQTAMDVGICRMVLDAFKQSLHELEGKTKLELKILHQDPTFWQVVLRSKLVQVSQKFSTQATSRTSFQEAEIRSAYIGTYCCSHASLVRAAVKSGCFPPLTEFIKQANDSERPLHVCCIGAGPGSEVIGLHEVLPKDTHWYLMDSCEQWSHSAQLLLRNIPGIKFNYGTFDITARFHPAHVFKKVSGSVCSTDLEKRLDSATYCLLMQKMKPGFMATLYAFVKFVSAIHFLKKSTTRFRELLRLTPPGSMFLFVDNAHHSVTRFIENLVFPDGVYEERKSCRENAFYAMYTCYAELHPTEESMKSSYVAELVSLVKYWLDRSPLLDFHVNVFLLVKKANKPVVCKSNRVSEKC